MFSHLKSRGEQKLRRKFPRAAKRRPAGFDGFDLPLRRRRELAGRPRGGFRGEPAAEGAEGAAPPRRFGESEPAARTARTHLPQPSLSRRPPRRLSAIQRAGADCNRGRIHDTARAAIRVASRRSRWQIRACGGRLISDRLTGP